MRFLSFTTRSLHIQALILSVGSVSFGATGEAYSPPPFERYQPILDRMPFGALPANFNPAQADAATLKNEAQVKAEQQAVAKKINMSAVNVTPEGSTAIGFTDMSVTPPISHYLRVGESADGWTVVSADYDTEIATIEKEGISITLKLGQGLVDTPAASPAGAKPALSGRMRPSISDRGPQPQAAPLLNQTIATPLRGLPKMAPASAAAEQDASRSYVERLRDRTKQKTQEQLAADKKLREQFEKLARETAAREIKKREEEAALAAQEQANQMQEEQPAQTENQQQPAQEPQDVQQ